jgi:hypothetical protein
MKKINDKRYQVGDIWQEHEKTCFASPSILELEKCDCKEIKSYIYTHDHKWYWFGTKRKYEKD